MIDWTRLAGKGFEPPPTATKAILVTRLSDWTLAGPAGNPLHSLEEGSPEIGSLESRAGWLEGCYPKKSSSCEEVRGVRGVREVQDGGQQADPVLGPPHHPHAQLAWHTLSVFFYAPV
jgi:hypothetical protein